MDLLQTEPMEALVIATQTPTESKRYIFFKELEMICESETRASFGELYQSIFDVSHQ